MNYKNCEIILYFSSDMNSYYQIKQWKKPLEVLNKKHKILLVLTDYEVYLRCLKEQIFELIYLEEYSDLITFYQNNEFGIILYINHALKNFNSISNSRAYHIHLNHGESEKESMRSNRSQAYDFVFTVGQRGTNRYKDYLLNFNKKKFIQVGRPQLDFIKQMKIKKNDKQKVILYAPTWEATHDSMNYTSVPIFGVQLVKTILKNKNNILIYKPHSALGVRNEDVKIAHKNILDIVNKSKKAYCMEEEDINNVFTLVDFAFFDNTSVMIDYLHTNKPASYIEVLSDQSINDLTKAFILLNKDNFSKLGEILEKALKQDSQKDKRKEVKKFYLGEYKKGESTQKFINEISKLIKKRNKKIKRIKK